MGRHWSQETGESGSLPIVNGCAVQTEWSRKETCTWSPLSILSGVRTTPEHRPCGSASHLCSGLAVWFSGAEEGAQGAESFLF